MRIAHRGNAAARPAPEPARMAAADRPESEIVRLIQRNMPGRTGQANSELVLHSQSQHLCKTLVPQSAAARCHQEMASAKQIVFLGSGYHDQDIRCPVMRLRNNDPSHLSPDELKASLAVDIDRQGREGRKRRAHVNARSLMPARGGYQRSPEPARKARSPVACHAAGSGPVTARQRPEEAPAAREGQPRR